MPPAMSCGGVIVYVRISAEVDYGREAVTRIGGQIRGLRGVYKGSSPSTSAEVRLGGGFQRKGERCNRGENIGGSR